MGERILRGPNSIIFGDIVSLKILLCAQLDRLDVEDYWEKIEHFYFIFKNKVNGCLESFLQFWFIYVKKS